LTEVQVKFAELIQDLREKAGLSQSQLAEKIGLPVRSIQNWEQGHRKPRAQVVLPLSRALGVSVEKLIQTIAEEPPAKKGKGRKGK
jgi:transcriptional regulator with XRE-family HTH domain